MKNLTFAERVLARLKLTGTAALALAFMAVMAGCDQITEALASSDANLAALTVSGGTLSVDFTPGTINYTVTVPYAQDRIRVNAAAAHPNAAVGGDAGVEKALEVGANTITIRVTAEDGTVKIYTITVTRRAKTDLAGAASISGFPKVGATLTADTGGLGGSGTISYVWKRGDSSGAVNEAISGASGNTYTLAQADLDKYLTVTVSREGYTGSVTSLPTARVAGPDAAAPTVNSVTVTAAAAAVQRGGTLQFTAAVSGTGLEADPAYRNVAWSIITGGFKAGTAIDQTGLLTVAADEEHTSLTIQALSALDSGRSGAAAVTITRPAVPDLTGAASISGLAKVGETLTADTGGLGGSGTISYVWKRGGSSGAVNEAISGASGNTYTLVQADLDKYLTVTVSREGYTGSVTSPATAKVAAADTAEPRVSLAELPNYIAGLPANSAGNPHTVKLAPVNIMENGVMGAINTAAANRYVIADLSACSATNDTISGNSPPGSNHMNVILSNQYIVGVILPDSLTTIGSEAFYSCSSLASVTIPSSVTTIGSEAFSVCSSLASVTIPSSVTTIGSYAFYACSSLASVTIQSGVTTIGNNAFSECDSLASVTIPGSVTTIANSAFSWCDSLASVTIQSGVTTIGNYAFSGCSSLASVTIPSSVTTIGNNAFSGCSKL
ncbi:MAG: leucine-rich repeat protein, partial [Treponema sp.]|nr:leucine-rich repeat protein [Treponema sp.]